MGVRLASSSVLPLQRGERMSEDEVKKIIAEADQNGDGKLNYTEVGLVM